MIPQSIIHIAQQVQRPIGRVWRFYYDGFTHMTVGKTLWTIILLKLFLFFAVIKLLFFPNLLSRDFDDDTQRADHVRNELLKRSE